jgi:hypothetical protein
MRGIEALLEIAGWGDIEFAYERFGARGGDDLGAMG